MQTNAIICPQCKRVVALGAELPASCYLAIPHEERSGLRAAELGVDPRAHHDCVVLEVSVPEGLPPRQQIAEVERMYAPQLAALAGLAALGKGG